MISYRKADLIDKIKSQSKSVEVVFDFHYDSNEQLYYLFIFDPTGIAAGFTYSSGNNFTISYNKQAFNLRNSIFNGCDGEFNETMMRQVHIMIDEFMETAKENLYNIRVKEDHVYKKPEGSKYLVFFGISK